MTTVSLDFTTADKFILTKSFSWRDSHIDCTPPVAHLARTGWRSGDGSVVEWADQPAEAG